MAKVVRTIKNNPVEPEKDYDDEEDDTNNPDYDAESDDLAGFLILSNLDYLIFFIFITVANIGLIS